MIGKKVIILLVAMLFSVGLCNGSSQSVPPLTVQIDGKPVNAPADMDIVQGQVMVPLGWAAEQLGATSVLWDQESRTITINTKQDIYNLEKLEWYADGLLQTFNADEEPSIFPLPDNTQNIKFSYGLPTGRLVTGWEFEQTSFFNPQYHFTIVIANEDIGYHFEFCQNTFSMHHDHYYVPMELLEYIFHARVNYNPDSNILSIQTPDMAKTKADINLVENTVISTSADDALKLWGRGEQTRNGALQYLALSPQLRQEVDKNFFVHHQNWVTGGSSPWVGPITIKNIIKITDSKMEYTISFPEMSSTGPDTTANEKMVIEKIPYNGQQGWFITQLLQSSAYGIINGKYQSTGLYLKDDRVSVPLPANWTIDYDHYILTIKSEQDRSIGACEELDGYYISSQLEILEDKKLTGGAGESHLLLLKHQTPPTSDNQESWQEVHAMIPLQNQHWLDISIKLSSGDNVEEIQTDLKNAIMGAILPIS